MIGKLKHVPSQLVHLLLDQMPSKEDGQPEHDPLSLLIQCLPAVLKPERAKLARRLMVAALNSKEGGKIISLLSDSNPDALKNLDGRGSERDVAAEAFRDAMDTELFIALLFCGSSIWQIRRSLKCMPSIPAVNCVTVAEHLCLRERFGEVVQAIDSFSNLPASIAKRLISEGYSEDVLKNLTVFDLKREEQAAVLRQAVEKCRLAEFLRLLGSLPHLALQDLESERHFIAFEEQIGMPAPKVYKRFLELSAPGRELDRKAFVHEVNSFATSLVSSQTQHASIALHPLFDELIRCVYPVHAQSDPSFCADRSFDLASFKFREKYRIDLAKGSDMVMRNGKSPDDSRIQKIEQTVSDVYGRLISSGTSRKDLQIPLRREMESMREFIPSSFHAPEDMLLALFTRVLTGEVQAEKVKELILGWQLSTFEDVEGYMNGTRDRAETARNSRYYYLLALREHYSDYLKDACDQIAQNAVKNPLALRWMQKTFKEHCEEQEWKRIQDILARHQAEKRGITDGLTRALTSVLSRPSRSPEESQKRKEALCGIISKEQQRIAELTRAVTDEDISADNVHLADYSRDNLLQHANLKVFSPADSSGLAVYFAERMQELFKEDLAAIDGELGKYAAAEEHSSKSEVLEAFFTKNHTSAYARAVGGVCVASDVSVLNAKEGFKNQWDLPNYFQLVLRDPRTRRCEGLVLLHHYEDKGKRIITASFNPTSTYLFKVNQADLFRELLSVLVSFARENGFDVVAVSANQQIRTNRTGGAFEAALNGAIIRKERFTLSSPQPFSFNPAYKQQELDVLWSADMSPDN